MNRFFVFLYLFLFIHWLPGCRQAPESNKEVVVIESGNKRFYGMAGTDSVYAYTLKSTRGLKAVISNYGATLLELWTPDRSGKLGNVILGYDSLGGYLQKTNPYFGAIVGRYANRISHARFTLDGKTYNLATNDRGNTLHGGWKGFDKVIWTVNQVNDSSLSLSYSSHDGEEGYPGNLTVKVVYQVNADNGLEIEYTALTDQKTPVNLTNHSYFNLSGGKDSTILNEELTLYASSYTPVNDSLIPTGQLVPVNNTPFDFRKAKRIGTDLEKVKGGYDHNFVIDKKSSELSMAAMVFDPGSGRKMEVWTTQPGIQFYTGNFLDGTLTGANGKRIVQHGALCLETQHFPDSPNQPGFPNTILEPGQTFHERTIYRFSVKP
jgi:aldose 1-epimerase